MSGAAACFLSSMVCSVEAYVVGADLVEKLVVVNGLQQIIDRADGVALALKLAGLECGGEENDRNVAGLLAQLEHLRGLEAVDLGHLYIEDDQVDVVLADELLGVLARRQGQRVRWARRRLRAGRPASRIVASVARAILTSVTRPMGAVQPTRCLVSSSSSSISGQIA